MPSSKAGNNKKGILVLGPGRSGTTMMANVLSRSGVTFIQNTVLCESATVQDINDAILSRSGYTWRTPPGGQILADKEQDSNIRRLLKEMDFDLVGIKDPRLTFTAVNWVSQMRMTRDVAIVAMRRHSSAVTKSIVKQQGLGGSVARGIWRCYASATLELWDTFPGPMFWVDYDRIVFNKFERARFADEMARFLGRPVYVSGIKKSSVHQKANGAANAYRYM